MFDQLIEYLRSRSVLILGFGREGRSTYDIIRRHLPDKVIGISDIREIDLNDPNVEFYSGKDYLKAIENYQVVIKTPGIALSSEIKPKNTTITCQTDLFLHFSDCLCVGVTGTKGKTIVSSLIYDMVKKENDSVCLIGNIGLPVLDTLEDGEPQIAIIEMSSHQLEFTTASPHIAMITNIFPEHLEHHSGFNGYVTSKLNIIRHQTGRDYFICSAERTFDLYYNFANVPSTVVKVASDSSGYEDYDAAIDDNSYLIGEHSRKNALMAACAASLLGIDRENICAAIREFKGVSHRLEPVGEYSGIRFYDDSTATIPQATMAAINAMPELDTLIFGGMSIGLEYDEFENFLFYSGITNLIGLPDTGRQTCTNLANRGCRARLYLAEDMEDAVAKAYEVTAKGRICLMSPAASSYNVYKDFEHKGNHFKDLVKKYDKNTEVAQ